MKQKIVLSFFALCLLAAGCYYDKEEDLYPAQGNCDVSNTTYSGTILRILRQYECLSCHSGPAPGGGIFLDEYSKLKTVVNNGRLLGAITHSPGFAPMPKDGHKMNACDIDRVKAWVAAGAPNN